MAKFYTPVKLSENISETPEGFLLCVGVPIARTGPMTYAEGETPLETDADGKIIIYRDAEDVFHVDTMASFEGKAITIKHPADFVSPQNWTYLAKGVVQNVRRGEKDEDGEESLIADLLVTDSLAISLIKNGLREVSCGYEAEYEQTGEGTGRQTKIIGNHLALVEQGRAGSSYAINDHKGVSTMSKLSDKLKNMFAKVVDEAVAEEKKDEKAKDEFPNKKEEKKDDKAKDEFEKKDGEKMEKSKDAQMYDELVGAVKDLMTRIEGMKMEGNADGGGKGINKEDKANGPGKIVDDKEDMDMESDDAAEEGEKSMEERLKALELCVSKLLEGQSMDDKEEMEKGYGEEKSKDAAEGEEGEESQKKAKDDDFEKSEMTGDTAARIEILAPGLKPSKDAKKAALLAAYNTKDGKAVLEALSGGKKPVLDTAEKVSTLFLAASEVLKSKRGNGFEKTKDSKAFDQMDATKKEVMTPEKLNELNAAHWARK